MELFVTDKTIDSKEFIKYAGSVVSTKKNYPISTTFRVEVQNIAINHLGLKDIGQLRDRFEGQAYMDNLLLKVSALYVLEKALEKDIIDWDTIRWEKKADFTLIKLNSKKCYRVIPFFFGSLPIVSTTIKEDIIFCGIRLDFKNGIVCGILSDYKFENKNLFIDKMSSSKRKLKKFIGFSHLRALNL